MEEIREFFANVPLEEEHFQLIYEYLAGQKIRVDGAGPAPEAAAQENAEEGESIGERADSLAIYLEELDRPEQSAEVRLSLFNRAAAGDREAGKTLIEQYLLTVCELAEEYESDVILTEDLIQEGNMGLILAVEELQPRESLAAYEAYLVNGISKAMEDACNEHRDRREMGRNVVSRVNQLNEAVHNLEEELEHKVTIEELSAYLDMPVEEIKDIMRMAGDNLDIG